MKATKLFSLIFLTIVFFSSCKLATKEDYSAIASDLCNCIDDQLKVLSPEMKNLIIEASNSNKDIEKAVEQYVEKNPEKAISLMQDASVMMNIDSKKFDTCLSSLESKYKNIKDKEKDMQDKLLSAMESKTECQLSKALMKLGMKK
ncbi:MAG: hypothetical protein FGM46_01650 [Ferruginibacter sp.]|nr:hypothetical protein [Ferruginibacter sp.]